MNLLIVYILVSDCHTITVMMFMDESVCSRVLGDEVFGYCYISCLNVTCVQTSLYICSDLLTKNFGGMLPKNFFIFHAVRWLLRLFFGPKTSLLIFALVLVW